MNHITARLPRRTAVVLILSALSLPAVAILASGMSGPPYLAPGICLALLLGWIAGRAGGAGRLALRWPKRTRRAGASQEEGDHPDRPADVWEMYENAGFPVWMHDLSGALVRVNRAYREMFLQAEQGTRTVGPERTRHLLSGACLDAASGEPTVHAGQDSTHLVREFWLVRQGQHVGRIGMSLPMPAGGERATENNPSAQNNLAVLRAVLETVPGGVAVSLRDHGDIWAVSRKIFDILGLGLDHGTVIEPFPPMSLDDLPAYRTPDGPPIRREDRILSRALAGQTIRDEEQYFHQPNGRVSRALVSASPIHNNNGERIGAVATWRDITCLSRLEEELADLLEREKLARRQAEEANWQKD
jgi:PAS domain-containing protein